MPGASGVSTVAVAGGGSGSAQAAGNGQTEGNRAVRRMNGRMDGHKNKDARIAQKHAQANLCNANSS
ncbi:MAG: hypothetical protein OHK0054_03920 [Sideroxydans sp.]